MGDAERPCQILARAALAFSNCALSVAAIELPSSPWSSSNGIALEPVRG
jgi:hypothetical protein